MANYTFGVETICPYYVREAKMSITCEGIIEGTHDMTRFGSTDDKLAFQQQNCGMYNYEFCCPKAAALAQKYAEDCE